MLHTCDSTTPHLKCSRLQPVGESIQPSQGMGIMVEVIKKQVGKPPQHLPPERPGRDIKNAGRLEPLHGSGGRRHPAYSQDLCYRLIAIFCQAEAG
ncbi:MAG: hypothetical protein ABIJ65_11380 [Chloroflexota bacterium]